MAHIITKTEDGFTIQKQGSDAVTYNLDDFDGVSSNNDVVSIVAKGTVYNLKLSDGITVNGDVFSGTNEELETLLLLDVFNDPGGTGAFADITGDPEDNAALAERFAETANKIT